MNNQQQQPTTLNNEADLTNWINRQIQNGVNADFLPKTDVIHHEETGPIYKGHQTESNFSHPPDQERTPEQIEALKKNRECVLGFRWEKDPEIEEEILRRRTEVNRLYDLGYNWWQIPEFGPLDEEPEHPSNVEIRNNYYFYDDSEWTEDEFFYMWDHALSKDAVKPIPW